MERVIFSTLLLALIIQKYFKGIYVDIDLLFLRNILVKLLLIISKKIMSNFIIIIKIVRIKYIIRGLR